MTSIKNLFCLLLDLSAGRFAIAVIFTLIPAMITMAFGIGLAIQYGYLLELSLSIALSTLILSLPLYLLGKKRNKTPPTLDESKFVEIKDDLIKASTDWSQQELRIWNESKYVVRMKLETMLEWEDMDKAALEVLAAVAIKFDKEALDFTIPEGLKLFEEISRRYKIVIKTHVPGVEYLKISYIRAGYEAFDKYGELGQKLFTAAIWANRARQLVSNPAKVAIDLVSEQTGNAMTRGFVDDIQYAAKKAFLDEVAAVAIDLYSGRFTIDDNDIEPSQALKEDEQQLAAELEPIRVVIVGQTGAGKSSLINALKQELAAEVDPLPSTDKTTAYDAMIDENQVRVVDLQGLDGNAKTEERTLREMTQSDVIIWVLKANQSARDLDKQLKDKFDAFYSEAKHISRQQPKIIVVLNQVDRLKPMYEWKPPYPLQNPDSPKAIMISKALHFNQQQMKSDVILPLCIAPDKTYFGLEKLQQTLVGSIVDANNVQRNRQRIEAMERRGANKVQMKRAVNLGKKVGPKVMKAAAPHLIGSIVKKIF